MKTLLDKTFSLESGYKELTQGAIDSIKVLALMIGPLLDTKERENRKLKRLLSERYNINNDNELLEEDIRVSSTSLRK